MVHNGSTGISGAGGGGVGCGRVEIFEAKETGPGFFLADGLVITFLLGEVNVNELRQAEATIGETGIEGEHVTPVGIGAEGLFGADDEGGQLAAEGAVIVRRHNRARER